MAPGGGGDSFRYQALDRGDPLTAQIKFLSTFLDPNSQTGWQEDEGLWCRWSLLAAVEPEMG
jgi:hypothetical protein